MGQIANVEYFYNKCNEVLKTNYTSSDWGEQNTYRPINIEWISLTVPKVYKMIHNPKNDCRLHLSTRFNRTYDKRAIPVEVVNSVVNYLLNFNKPCDTECACYRDKNCNCVCNPNSTCNCNCNCDCECGSNTECVCDCSPYDCNCDQVLNCNYGNKRPMQQNCECQCPCPCECDCPAGGNPPVTGGGEPIHRHHDCEDCCPEYNGGYRLSGMSYNRYWLVGCQYSGPGRPDMPSNCSTSITMSNCPSGWWCCS